MSSIKAVSTAILAGALALAVTGHAAADSLANLHAYTITAVQKKAQAVSTRTGSRIRHFGARAFGAAADPAFRAMVKLEMRYRVGTDRIMTEHCGGTVIGSRWIVTAAHCVTSPDGERWERIDIVTGDRDLDGHGTIRRTAHDAIVHSGFDYPTLTNDIALIRLREPLPRQIEPASLDRARAPSVLPGDIARAAGWPVTGADAGMKRLQTPALSIKAVAIPGYITATSLYGTVEGVCQGESGGPLISEGNGAPRLAGILSGIEANTRDAFGEPCMKAGYEMYFTPIAAFRNWIDAVRRFCDRNPRGCSGGASAPLLAGSSVGQARYAANTRSTY